MLSASEREAILSSLPDSYSYGSKTITAKKVLGMDFSLDYLASSPVISLVFSSSEDELVLGGSRKSSETLDLNVFASDTDSWSGEGLALEVARQLRNYFFSGSFRSLLDSLGLELVHVGRVKNLSLITTERIYRFQFEITLARVEA